MSRRPNNWALGVLEEVALPFITPSAFMAELKSNVVQATVAPIFSDVPEIRYQKDTLDEGLRVFPDYCTDDVISALDVLSEKIDNFEAGLELLMPSDSMMLVDNHVALHARTAFKDNTRHLLRIRIKDENLMGKGVCIVSKEKSAC